MAKAYCWPKTPTRVSYKTTVVNDNGETTVRVAGRPYKVKVQDEQSVVVDGRPLSSTLSGLPTAAGVTRRP